MSDRYTIEQVEDGDWLVFDNEAFYCCYSGSSEQDAFAELNRLNTRNQNKALGETLTASIEVNKDLHKRIAELEKERDALVVRVTNCEKIFSDASDLEFSRFKEMFPDEFEAHNLEQQAKALEGFAEKSKGYDWEDSELQMYLSSVSRDLRLDAAKLKEGEQ